MPMPITEATAADSASTRAGNDAGDGHIGGSGETRPKLKPLHWDKVRATSDRAMVWDQLKSSSFQLRSCYVLNALLSLGVDELCVMSRCFFQVG
jgi:hypothetical protein